MKKLQMKRLIFGIALLFMLVVSISSCKSGCGCPKFQMEQVLE